jgi:hypothetical protein
MRVMAMILMGQRLIIIWIERLPGGQNASLAVMMKKKIERVTSVRLLRKSCP